VLALRTTPLLLLRSHVHAAPALTRRTHTRALQA
jgi:hypothetical protein